MQTRIEDSLADRRLPPRPANYHGLASLEYLAYERVKEAIITLVLPPGEPLSEIQISEQLGISRTPLHTALVQLEREGFVITVPYKGSRVAPITLQQMTHFFELREAIERYAIHMAARSFTEVDFVALETILERRSQAVEQGEIVATFILGEEFHNYIVDQRGNPHFTEIFRNTSDHRLRLRHALARAGQPPRSGVLLGHPLKLAALRNGDAAEAERLVVESIRARLAEVEAAERAGLLTPGSRTTHPY